ncbi:MAG: hypothetical protein IKO23_07720 [Bacteroidales bacterium]|nr:hypothetical protein [Bacteroidales bacterium]
MDENEIFEPDITYKEMFDLALGETIEPITNEKQLNDILNSESFELTIRALGDRNPYFARHVFRHHDIMTIIQKFCEIANHVEKNFETHIMETYDVSLEEYEKLFGESIDVAKMDYYGDYLLEEEPMPISYDVIIDVLKDSNIEITPEQDEKLQKQLSPFTDEECEDLVKRCREAPEVFGWITMDNKPLYKE